MREEEESSILKNKFREWFEKIVPEPPDVIDHTIGDPVLDDLPHLTEIDRSIEDHVPNDLPLFTETDHLKLRIQRRRVNKTAKLLELLAHGFSVAVVFGAVVGVIIVILDLSFFGGDGNYRPFQSLVIILAMAIGFNIGLIKGHASQKRKRHFY